MSSVIAAMSIQTGAPGTPVDGGDVAIVDTSGQLLMSGGSSTVFGLALPKDAACPGDSLNDGWIVQSFVVPEETDPGAIVYRRLGPDEPRGYALISLERTQFMDELTLANIGPGRPGKISLPVFSFAEYKPGVPAPGRYRVGIACTTGDRRTGVFWDTVVEFAADPADAPAQMRWSVVERPDLDLFGVAGADSNPDPFLLIAAVVAIVGAALLLVSHRERRAGSTEAPPNLQAGREPDPGDGAESHTSTLNPLTEKDLS
jgi:hypothetical protein